MSTQRVDYDLFDPAYAADPAPAWKEFRTNCPVARSELYGGSWLPARYDDVVAAARDITNLISSEGVSVIDVSDMVSDPVRQPAIAPPIDADPPMHTWTRRLMLPPMSPGSVRTYEAGTRALCRKLIAGFIDTGEADAAAGYAQQIPVRVIGALLGVEESRSDQFVDWVRSILEFANDGPRRANALRELRRYLFEQVAIRLENPTDDFLSTLAHSEVDGSPVPIEIVVGEASLLLVAGIDTTWSAIGSSLFHLATHPGDLQRMVEDPDVWPTAIEEFLRFYSPVTMARIAANDTEVGGCPVAAGDRVLMNFPGANRDEEHFERPDEFIIDRERNRHLAFGVGIHRCAGSNLARMELRIALEEWISAIPTFTLKDPALVTWAGGQVRGPRSIPVVFCALGVRPQTRAPPRAGGLTPSARW
ncbi:MAG: cytochrome P450 [Acidimicrobiales bacterium]